MQPLSPIEKNTSGLWLFVVGFVAMAILTLGLAVGTSVWQQDSGVREFIPGAPVAQK